MTNRIFILLIVTGMLAACTGQDIASSPHATIPTRQKNMPNLANAIEVIVFTWDWPMMANIPPIHIWKDGRAIWVVYSSDNKYHVYETLLSNDEVVKVQDTLANSGYWEDKQQEAASSDASNLVIWASLSGKEKSLGVGNTKYETIVSSLQEIMESSTNKKEYFPQSAYMFASRGAPLSDYSFLWPDEEVDFDFSQALQGVYVDGLVLSTTWEAIQNGDSLIVSRNTSYKYALKIPGVSCIISYDPYTCTIYEFEPR